MNSKLLVGQKKFAKFEIFFLTDLGMIGYYRTSAWRRGEKARLGYVWRDLLPERFCWVVLVSVLLAGFEDGVVFRPY